MNREPRRIPTPFIDAIIAGYRKASEQARERHRRNMDAIRQELERSK